MKTEKEKKISSSQSIGETLTKGRPADPAVARPPLCKHLSDAERKRSVELTEEAITLLKELREGEKSSLALGRIILTIREDELFRETHRTIEAWCAETLDIGKSQAYNLANTANVYYDPDFSTYVESGDFPSAMSPYLLLPLTKVESVEDRIRACRRAVENKAASGKPVTHKDIAKAIRQLELLPPKKKKLLSGPVSEEVLQGLIAEVVTDDMPKDEEKMRTNNLKRIANFVNGPLTREIKPELKQAAIEDLRLVVNTLKSVAAQGDEINSA